MKKQIITTAELNARKIGKALRDLKKRLDNKLMDTCAKCKNCGRKHKLEESDLKQYKFMLTCKCGRTVYDPEIEIQNGFAHNIISEGLKTSVCECNNKK
jgi:hypothetical protein